MCVVYPNLIPSTPHSIPIPTKSEPRARINPLALFSVAQKPKIKEFGKITRLMYQTWGGGVSLHGALLTVLRKHS